MKFLTDIQTIHLEPNGPIILVGNKRVSRLEDLTVFAPHLVTDKHVAEYAKAANYLAGGYDYSVIKDPGLFRENYLRRRAIEDVEANVEVFGRGQLQAHGLPDFTAITAPRLEGSTLHFFAEHLSLGYAYIVTVKIDGTATYVPMDLS